MRTLAWSRLAILIIGSLLSGCVAVGPTPSAEPTTAAVSTSTSAPAPTPTATVIPAAPSGTAATAGSPFRVRFFDETSSRDVVIEIDDRSGLLVAADRGRLDVPWAHVKNERGDAAVANDPSDPRVVRLDWFSPGGCDDRYGLLIDGSARSMTIATSYVVGGDSIGGNCVVTLRFSEAVPAAEIDVTLANTAPPPDGHKATEIALAD